MPRGMWGPDDEIGMWNNLSEEKTAAAARLVTVGRRFNLNLPLHIPLGLIREGAHAVRKGPTPTMFEVGVGRIMGRDDKVEIYNQASTQWDGLTHVGDREHGFYNGVRPDQVTHGEGGRNGIGKVAEHGIATRAVLVDLPRHFASRGRPWHPMGSHAASAADIADCLEATGVALGQGDVLLVRTGWLGLFLNAVPEKRYGLFHDRDYSGLSGQPDMWEFLWDRRVAAVASDSVAVEAFPITAEQPSLHLAIARLGLNLGEMFDLEALAAFCHETGRHECFFTSMPLNLRGGVGSPANAMAIL
jgi:kynurenine formamidase